ncbi:hypothetical protein QYE76_041689 [Lolium multiflorum]|uniref:Uncharacterized protein n=1 Tax=Lolium multiflorum TaxID=4521 RepID=A0AAD8TEA6_LOLMU|nr:hypothetical protein QYE76_041689 [Lolium multiflorum]
MAEAVLVRAMEAYQGEGAVMVVTAVATMVLEVIVAVTRAFAGSAAVTMALVVEQASMVMVLTSMDHRGSMLVEEEVLPLAGKETSSLERPVARLATHATMGTGNTPMRSLELILGSSTEVEQVTITQLGTDDMGNNGDNNGGGGNNGANGDNVDGANDMDIERTMNNDQQGNASNQQGNISAGTPSHANAAPGSVLIRSGSEPPGAAGDKLLLGSYASRGASPLGAATRPAALPPRESALSPRAQRSLSPGMFAAHWPLSAAVTPAAAAADTALAGEPRLAADHHSVVQSTAAATAADTPLAGERRLAADQPCTDPKLKTSATGQTVACRAPLGDRGVAAVLLGGDPAVAAPSQPASPGLTQRKLTPVGPSMDAVGQLGLNLGLGAAVGSRSSVNNATVDYVVASMKNTHISIVFGLEISSSPTLVSRGDEHRTRIEAAGHEDGRQDGREAGHGAGHEDISWTRGRSGRHAREEKKKSRPENKNSADIITWREYEALRNEMRREFRTNDDELKSTVDEIKQTLDATNVTVTGLSDQMTDIQRNIVDMRLAIENLTVLQQQQQEDDDDPELEDDAHNARGAPRGHRPRGLVPLGRNGRGQDEEDGLGVKTVDEYYMEMEMLMQRGRVRESLEMTMQRFLNGLNWLKKQRLRDVLQGAFYTPRALYSAGAFDALRSLLYSA